jgi:hypothetical protein
MSHSQLHGTVTDEEGSEQYAVKRHRFHDIFDLVLGCFYNQTPG